MKKTAQLMLIATLGVSMSCTNDNSDTDASDVDLGTSIQLDMSVAGGSDIGGQPLDMRPDLSVKPQLDLGEVDSGNVQVDMNMGADAGAVETELKAFPTAEGYGKYAVGGRGGRVIKVTNLNDSGPGSFREACESSGKRIVVFEVGGRIDVKSTIKITDPNITIAGQHSVGDGIMLTKEEGPKPIMEIAADEVIMRYIRFRRSTAKASGNNPDNLWVNRGKNIVVDHCSFAWATDGNFDIANYDGTSGQRPETKALSNITVQYNIFTNPYGGANKNFLVSRGPSEVSWWRNAWLSTATRNPSISTPSGEDAHTWDSHFEHINNFHYDYSNGPSYSMNAQNTDAGIFHSNVINNKAKENNNSEGVSPTAENTTLKSRRWLRAKTVGNGMKIYVSGNITPYRPNDTYGEWEVGQNGGGQADKDVLIPENLRSSTINDTPIIRDNVPLWSADDIWDNFKAHVGASLPTRDAEDARAVNDVETGASTENKEENTFPVIKGGTPLPDSDDDGMPDAYEMKTFNTIDRDGTETSSGNVYTDLEVYLNLRAQENQ